MTPEEKKLWAAELLREKQKETGRLPRKEDFDDATRSRIKAFLGPWPRALEAAGLKEAKQTQKKKRKKRSDGKGGGSAAQERERNAKREKTDGYLPVSDGHKGETKV